MSEPRKLNTGSAYGTGAGAPSADARTAYHAGQAASQGGGRHLNQRAAIPQPTDPALEASRQAARQMAPTINRQVRAPSASQGSAEAAPAPRPVHDPEAIRAAQARYAQQRAVSHQGYQQAQYKSSAEVKAAMRARQQEAMARRAAEATGSFAPVRTQVKQLDLNKTQGAGKLYDINGDAEFAERQRQKAAQVAQAAQQAVLPVQPVQEATLLNSEASAGGAARQQVYRSSAGKSSTGPSKASGSSRSGGAGRSAGGNGGNGGKPPRGSKGGRGDKGGAGPYNKNGKQKKRGSWWKILLGTLLAIVLIFGATLAIITHAIAPEAGSISINQLINTPKEFQGKEFNILVTGVDRSSTGDLSAGAANDSNVNDGMTDMILYLHFNNETGKVSMLQVPRDTMVTTDAGVSGNFRINGVAKTQGSNSNNNMAALCELFADQYKLPVDGYITIRLEMLVEMVDLFGGVELNVPIDMDFDGSHLDAGYQTLNGAACEFLLRARKIYPDGDIGRLNMQRQFYAALFRKLKSIGSIWDVAKLTPAVLNYMQTDLNISELVSFAVSMLKVESANIMLCQMPVVVGPLYNDQALVYPARQADADLLNTYFRENTGAVDASALNVCDNAVDLNGYSATDPNVQFMGSIMNEQADAQKNNNLDGSHAVEYADTASSDAASSDATGESEASSPAA